MDMDDRDARLMNSIELDFADGVYNFALPLAQIDELQRKCGAGIGAIFARVIKGAHHIGDDVVLAPASAEFYALDVIETIRQGLIGGKRGMVDGKEIAVTPGTAHKLINNYVLEQPLSYAWEFAVSILGAVIVGYNPPGEAEPPKAAAGTEPSTSA